jgi:hypothetical protein
MENHGRYKGLRKIAREHGVSYLLLQSRIRNGWTMDQALTIPPGQRRAAVPKPPKSDPATVGEALSSWKVLPW